MVKRFLVTGFLLLELLALGLLAAPGDGTVRADPLYNNHQLRFQCLSSARDCGTVCFYANCIECDQCCSCWEICERETCRERCRTVRTTNGERER